MGSIRRESLDHVIVLLSELPRHENGLALFARALLPSPGLNRSAPSLPVGKFRADRGRTHMNFPILYPFLTAMRMPDGKVLQSDRFRLTN